jgi:hypothetical protein
MFGPSHYVPILRWKQAERFALRHLLAEDRKRITPLIELTPAVFARRKRAQRAADWRNTTDVIYEESKRLLEACGNFPFFLDLRYVEDVPKSRGKHPLEGFADLGRSYKLEIVPVTGLNREKEYQSSVRTILEQDKRGLCLRLTPAHILAASFPSDLKGLFKNLGAREEYVDMLIDFEANTPSMSDVDEVLGALPNLNAWRTLSIASGAFPPDLQRFSLGNQRIPRSDWLSWKKAISQSQCRGRKPTFSDYTIQYGLYKEPVEGSNPSVSVRYTLDEEWLIMRGEAVRGKLDAKRKEARPGREQWHGHAQLLCDSPDLFYGESFSWGDAFILERSRDRKNYGSPEIWLRAGINHHMTVVCRQIAILGAL